MKSYLGNAVMVHRSRWSLIPPGIGWCYADPDGLPVLKHEVGWRKINGVRFATTGGLIVWLQFRRRG